MAEITEGRHCGEFIFSEANGTLSLETVTIDTGDLAAGTVLGKITASGKYVQLNPAGEDGSENAAGILYDNVDATDGDVEATIVARLAEVNGSELTWPTITDEQKAAAVADLAALSIIVR